MRFFLSDVAMPSKRVVDTVGPDDMEFDVPDRPDVPGLAFRRVRVPGDFTAIAGVMLRSREADSVGLLVTTEEVRATFEHPVQFDPHLDALIVEVRGEPVGYVRVSWDRQRDGTRLYGHWDHLVPEWRGRGLREAMLRWADARRARIASAQPGSGPRYLQTMVAEPEAERIAALEAGGYRPARWFFEMLRQGLDDVPDRPLPPGIEVRPATPDHYRAVLMAAMEAFTEEWDGVEPSEERLEGWLASPLTDPSLWQVAWDGDTVVGTVLPFINREENARYSRRWGYTESIMVREGYRGRGIAKALIARALVAVRERGMEAANLGVDSENRSGALRLYEGMGYRPYRRWVIYRKPL
jgi:GNAT superfamily N-acetyltransferase